MGCDWAPIDAGCLVCALDESFCQGLSSLACCSRQNQSIGEVMRRAAKNTEGVTDFLCAALWQKSTLLPPIALVTNANGYSSLLDSLARFLAAKCLQMSRHVYKCIRMSRQFQFFGTLFCVLPNRSSPCLMDTGRTIWGHFATFRLTAFACKFSLGESSGFSVRAPRMSTIWARHGFFLDSGSFRGLVPIRCNYPGLGRPKST